MLKRIKIEIHPLYMRLRGIVRDHYQTVALLIAIVTLALVAWQSFSIASQTKSVARQVELLTEQTGILGNQTRTLAEQTNTLQSDYMKRTRPYLRLTGITIQDGNSSNVLDIVLALQNAGQVPATKAWLGELEGGEVGIYIAAEDLKYNESTGKFTATNPTGLCMPSLSAETTNVPKSTPVEKSSGTSIGITITATPCWLAAINKTGVPEDQIFYPNISGNQIITVNKSAYYEAIKILDTAHKDSMQIGLKYYGEGHEYYYIATLQKLTDTKWIVKPIEKGN
jgi:hypothetical protein